MFIIQEMKTVLVEMGNCLKKGIMGSIETFIANALLSGDIDIEIEEHLRKLLGKNIIDEESTVQH